jgi:Tfp pilus assembly protein FimT
MDSLTVRTRKFNAFGHRGFSLIELLIMVAIVMVMVAVSIPYAYNYRKLYRSEEQAMKVMDLLRETSQMALNHRRTYRLEIDATANAALIIDENSSAQPDRLVKRITLDDPSLLRMDVAPATVGRPTPPNYPTAVFANDVIGHMEGSTNVINNRVWAAHFKSDGTVVSATDVPVSVTLYVFPPTSATSDVATDKKQIRVITIYGGSGAVRYWKYDGTNFLAS